MEASDGAVRIGKPIVCFIPEPLIVSSAVAELKREKGKVGGSRDQGRGGR
jgi:hypothetical protein